ncbi:MAG TPA: AAA family ATPase, partial [Candidatus Dormibacteraeota bacterium]
MDPPTPGRPFVGRETPLARLAAAVDGARADRAPLVLVSGEAGIGKTSLVAEAARRASGVEVGLGTCWAGPGAPGYWPWTQALGELASAAGPVATDLAEADRRLLSGILPAFGPAPVGEEEDAGRARLRLFDAVCRWLVRLGRSRTVLVVLDDLQWADQSSLELLAFLARSRPGPGVVLIGVYRHDELRRPAAEVLGELASRADTIHLGGLTVEEVGDLVAVVAGRERAGRWAQEVYRRSEGHPFFARELVHALGETGQGGVPRAVRAAIRRRLDRLAPPARSALDAAALLGNRPDPDILADALGGAREAVDDALGHALDAGVLAGPRDRPRFAHDLFREAVIEALPAASALDLHHRLARALEARHDRTGDVPPAEIAGHAIAALAIDGPDAALRWALAAAAADQGRLALAEAAAHLTRLREALAGGSVTVAGGTWIDLLVAEAGALGRAGRPDEARQL